MLKICRSNWSWLFQKREKIKVNTISFVLYVDIKWQYFLLDEFTSAKNTQRFCCQNLYSEFAVVYIVRISPLIGSNFLVSGGRRAKNGSYKFSRGSSFVCCYWRMASTWGRPTTRQIALAALHCCYVHIDWLRAIWFVNNC